MGDYWRNLNLFTSFCVSVLSLADEQKEWKDFADPLSAHPMMQSFITLVHFLSESRVAEQAALCKKASLIVKFAKLPSNAL